MNRRELIDVLLGGRRIINKKKSRDRLPERRVLRADEAVRDPPSGLSPIEW